MDNLPIFTVGSANGRLRTGLHVRAQGDPATRVGLTVQQALGVPVYSWGALSNETSKTITDLVRDPAPGGEAETLEPGAKADRKSLTSCGEG